MDLKDIFTSQKEKLKTILSKQEMAFGEIIFNNGQCQVLSQSSSCVELIVEDPAGKVVECKIHIEESGNIIPEIMEGKSGWDKSSFACLLQAENELHLLEPGLHEQHKKYTREGMIQRVLKERRQKAEKAKYRIEFANNIFGDHTLINENGVKYKIFLRDFEKETGYSNSHDSKLNKLGTTKHIMYAFNMLKENKVLFERLDQTFPFVEIFCDPLNDYKITWYYPHSLSTDEQLLISRYFKKSSYIEDSEVTSLLGFIQEASEMPHICIRPEVVEKVEATFEKRMLAELKEQYTPDFSKLNAELYDYQKEGIQFALFRKAVIIADEMGLGKTIQAIGTAVLKKEVFGFTKTLVVCPASLKYQWKKEIEKFSSEKAIVVDGLPSERESIYHDPNHYFFIVNYETVLRDQIAMNRAGIDLLILDEAQRAKNFETKTTSSLKNIRAKHKLVITGTPIENRLIDIYSIVGIIDPQFFGPLWEFSYKHCLFDPDKPNKINGYYNLQELNKKLEEVLIRREKRKVMDQLPNVRQIEVPLNLSPLQADFHGSYAKGLAQIIRKKFLTPYDLQRMQLLLANMRMVCDSTCLIDDATNESPKLDELKHILLDKLDLANSDKKIIIFSEWVKVHKLIGRLLRENNIGFVELNGQIPVKSRSGLIKKFEDNPQYKVFLSTEAGGSGLNLQVADTLINFELPWNPAKKNQRIGRIDRIGQRSNKLTIYNFITRNSIEQQIASGLLVKQSLFDGVLGSGEGANFVDFSSKGRSQFIQQLEAFIAQTEQWDREEEMTPSGLLQSQDILEPSEIEATNRELIFNDPDEVASVEALSSDNLIPSANKTVEMETVMNSGMQFLSGLFKMTTGKDMGLENQKIEINQETGEVTMKFKIPGFIK